MLQNKELLLSSKNLLAFSAGVDSTALFFLLLNSNISFDIAIVNYGLREQAKEEVAYAKELAKKHNLGCFVFDAELISSNFEANARKIRYDFFETLIQENNYNTLLTAHHLGDRLEWMLMQFCKGAGCIELSGMKQIEKREHYQLIRPLLHVDKQELLEYLNHHAYDYFLDASNSDTKYKRNEFRHNYAQPLLKKYLSGIKKSFEYMDEDVDILSSDAEILYCNRLAYFKSTGLQRSDTQLIDKYFKSMEHLITANERKLIKEKKSVVISRKFIVNQEHSYVFIAPYIKGDNLSKKLKEKCRILKIEPKLRGYLASDSEAVELISLLLQ